MEKLIEEMTALGFRHDGKFGLATATFTKTYLVKEGHIVQVGVSYDKPIMGAPGMKLACMTVTEQQVVMPTKEGVAQTPATVQADLQQIVMLSETQNPSRSLEVRECGLCHQLVPEFYIINDEVICNNCGAS